MTLKREPSYPKQKQKQVTYLNKLIGKLFNTFSTTKIDKRLDTKIDTRLDSVSHYPRVISNANQKSEYLHKLNPTIQKNIKKKP